MVEDGGEAEEAAVSGCGIGGGSGGAAIVAVALAGGRGTRKPAQP